MSKEKELFLRQTIQVILNGENAGGSSIQTSSVGGAAASTPSIVVSTSLYQDLVTYLQNAIQDKAAVELLVKVALSILIRIANASINEDHPEYKSHVIRDYTDDNVPSESALQEIHNYIKHVSSLEQNGIIVKRTKATTLPPATEIALAFAKLIENILIKNQFDKMIQLTACNVITAFASFRNIKIHELSPVLREEVQNKLEAFMQKDINERSAFFQIHQRKLNELILSKNALPITYFLAIIIDILVENPLASEAYALHFWNFLVFTPVLHQKIHSGLTQPETKDIDAFDTLTFTSFIAFMHKAHNANQATFRLTAQDEGPLERLVYVMRKLRGKQKAIVPLYSYTSANALVLFSQNNQESKITQKDEITAANEYFKLRCGEKCSTQIDISHLSDLEILTHIKAFFEKPSPLYMLYISGNLDNEKDGWLLQNGKKITLSLICSYADGRSTPDSNVLIICKNDSLSKFRLSTIPSNISILSISKSSQQNNLEDGISSPTIEFFKHFRNETSLGCQIYLQTSMALDQIYTNNNLPRMIDTFLMVRTLKQHQVLLPYVINNQQITDNEFKNLCNFLQNQKLLIENHSITDQGIIHLTQRLIPPYYNLANTLTELVIKNNAQRTISQESLKAVGKMLARNLALQAVKCVNFGNMGESGDEGAIEIANALKSNTTLLRLSLIGCQIGTNGITALTQALIKQKSIISLILSQQSLTHSCYEIGMMLSFNSVLSILALNNAEMSTHGCQQICHAILRNPNSALSHLSLAYNNNISTPDGIGAIAQLLSPEINRQFQKQPHIEVLCLSGIAISPDLMKILIQGLYGNLSLKALRITFTSIEALKLLIRALQAGAASSLTSLELDPPSESNMSKETLNSRETSPIKAQLLEIDAILKRNRAKVRPWVGTTILAGTYLANSKHPLCHSVKPLIKVIEHMLYGSITEEKSYAFIDRLPDSRFFQTITDPVNSNAFRFNYGIRYYYQGEIHHKENNFKGALECYQKAFAALQETIQKPCDPALKRQFLKYSGLAANDYAAMLVIVSQNLPLNEKIKYFKESLRLRQEAINLFAQVINDTNDDSTKDVIKRIQFAKNKIIEIEAFFANLSQQNAIIPMNIDGGEAASAQPMDTNNKQHAGTKRKGI